MVKLEKSTSNFIMHSSRLKPYLRYSTKSRPCFGSLSQQKNVKRMFIRDSVWDVLVFRALMHPLDPIVAPILMQRLRQWATFDSCNDAKGISKFHILL